MLLDTQEWVLSTKNGWNWVIFWQRHVMMVQNGSKEVDIHQVWVLGVVNEWLVEEMAMDHWKWEGMFKNESQVMKMGWIVVFSTNGVDSKC